MNFTLKALVAAAALVASASASAALVSGVDTGDMAAKGTGELFLSVVDTKTGVSFVYDLANIGGNDFTMNSFAAGTSAAGQSYSWATSSTAAWSAFSAAAAGNTLVWMVSGIDAAADPAIADADGNADTTVAGQVRVVSTVNNTNTTPLTAFGQNALNGMASKTGLQDQVNTLSSAADPAVIVTAPNTLPQGSTFAGLLGKDWGGNFVNSTNAIGASSQFVSLTGNGTIDKLGITTYAGTFKFDGTALTYTVAVASVPESDTYAMLLAGLGVMGMVARRRLAA